MYYYGSASEQIPGISFVLRKRVRCKPRPWGSAIGLLWTIYEKSIFGYVWSSCNVDAKVKLGASAVVEHVAGHCTVYISIFTWVRLRLLGMVVWSFVIGVSAPPGFCLSAEHFQLNATWQAQAAHVVCAFIHSYYRNTLWVVNIWREGTNLNLASYGIAPHHDMWYRVYSGVVFALCIWTTVDTCGLEQSTYLNAPRLMVYQ